MKKFLALALCAIMMLSSIITTPASAAATESERPTHTSTHTTTTTTTKSDGTKTVTVVQEKTVSVFDGTRTTATVTITTTVDGKTVKVEEKPGGNFVGQLLDVPEDYWAASHIDWCQEYGIMNGQDDWMFDPSGKLTQAGVCQIALNALRLTKGLKSTSTTSGGAWYQEALDVIREITGIYIVTPDAPATRELSCIIIDAIFPTSGKQPTVVLPSDCTGLPASSWEAISRCYAAKWVNGSTDGLFHPDSTLTRAEAAKIISLATQDNLPPSAKSTSSPSKAMTVKDRALARSEKVKAWAGQYGWTVEQSTTRLKGDFCKEVTLRNRNGKYLTLQFGGPTAGSVCYNRSIDKNGDGHEATMTAIKNALSEHGNNK